MSDEQGQSTPPQEQPATAAPEEVPPSERAAPTPDVTAPTPESAPPGGAPNQPAPTPGTSDQPAPQAPQPDQPEPGTSPNPTQGDPADNVIPSASEGAVPAQVEGDDEETTWRNQQLAAAAAQGIQGENAVPEQRPQAFATIETPSSPLTQRMEDEGIINNDPMPKSAYDAANDEGRKEQTAKEGVSPAPTVGTVIQVTEGAYRDRKAAVVRVISYPAPEDRLAAMSGDPALRDFAVPAEIEVRFRGDDRDGEMAVLNLNDKDDPSYAEYVIVPAGFAGRGSLMGSL